MDFDINQLGSPPLFEVVPYIHNTNKAAIHIRGGDFQEVVFVVANVRMDVEMGIDPATAKQVAGDPFFEIKIDVVEWNEKIFPDATAQMFEENELFQSEVARIMNTVIMASLARALEERKSLGESADKTLRDILKEQGVDINESGFREAENAESHREDDSGGDAP